MKRLILAALFCSLSLGTGLARANPLWTSDQVRQARSLAESQALVFELRRETSRPDKPVEIATEIVTLTPTFTHIVEGDKQTLEDHALCRTMSWNRTANMFTSYSCYAVVAFKLVEIENRAVLNQIASKDRLFSAEASSAELGILGARPSRLEMRQTRDGREYRVGNATLTSVRGSASEVSAEEMRGLIRFLARYAPLHPQIRGDIASARVLPASIDVDAGPLARERLRISNVHRVPVAYPLPAGLTAALSEEARLGGSPRALALRTVSQALGGTVQKPTAEATLATMRAALTSGRGLEAVWLFMQLTQEHAVAFKPVNGAPSPVLIGVRAMLPQLRADPEAARLMAISDLAGDAQAPGDRQAAARFLSSPRMEGLAYGTFRNVTYANLLTTSPASKDWDPTIRAAMPPNRVDNYWIHIQAHPWSSNTFKDAGDAYYGAYDVVSAWTAFDLGRAVDPDWREGVMSAVGKFEGQMRQRQPDYF